MKKFNANQLIKDLNDKFKADNISIEVLDEGLGSTIGSITIDHALHDEYIVAVKITAAKSGESAGYAIWSIDDIDTVSDFIEDRLI